MAVDWNGESLQVGGLPEREATKSQLIVINRIIIGVENSVLSWDFQGCKPRWWDKCHMEISEKQWVPSARWFGYTDPYWFWHHLFTTYSKPDGFLLNFQN